MVEQIYERTVLVKKQRRIVFIQRMRAIVYVK